MNIVFAENFQNDIPESLELRYPGTVCPSISGAPPNTFPLRNRLAHIQTGVVPFTDDVTRFEVRFDFPEQPEGTGSENATLHIFGIELEVLANNGGIRIGDTVIPPFPNARSMNLVVEREESEDKATILVDDDVVLNPTSIGEWVPSSWVGVSIKSGAAISAAFPYYMSSIVVATNTPEGTRLGTPSRVLRTLSVTDAGEWQFSGEGYVEDVDKADPTQRESTVYSSTLSTITYQVSGDIENKHINLYVGGFTEHSSHALKVGDIVYGAAEAGHAFALGKVTSNNIDISVVETGSISNGLGLLFYGEVQLISYEDLSTEVNYTEGVLMPDAGWLHVNLDGKELYVAKHAIRTDAGWDILYEAGLVYGVDGPGPHPVASGPVNQMRTVVIEGKTYIVRLLKGADVNPSSLNLDGIDPPGSQKSEWSRIFAPLTVDGFASYTGPKLANYAGEDFGTGEPGEAGRVSWVQESPTIPGNLRNARGGPVLDRIDGFNPAAAALGYGWRPVLELVP